VTLFPRIGLLLVLLSLFFVSKRGFADCQKPEDYTPLYFERFEDLQSFRVSLLFVRSERDAAQRDVVARKLDLDNLRRPLLKGYIKLSQYEATEIALKRAQLRLRGLDLRLKGADKSIEFQELLIHEGCMTDGNAYDPDKLIIVIEGYSTGWQFSVEDRKQSLELTRRELKLAKDLVNWSKLSYSKGFIVKAQLQQAIDSKKGLDDRIHSMMSANTLSEATIEKYKKYVELFEQG